MTLAESPAEPPAVATPPAGRIETDLFCPGCGYNLHGLDVTRDPRLEISIVRCPECGKFHPAGIAIGAGRAWLTRLVGILLILWVTFIFVMVFGSGFWMFGMDIAAVDGFARYQNVMVGPINGWMLVPLQPEDFASPAAYWIARLMLHGFSLAAGAFLGSFLTVFLYHIRRPWWLLAAAIPFIAALIVWSAYYLDGARTLQTSPWITPAIWQQAFFQCLGLIFGLLLGRVITRALLRVLLTRRLLQHAAHLWQIDGLKAPSPKP